MRAAIRTAQRSLPSLNGTSGGRCFFEREPLPIEQVANRLALLRRIGRPARIVVGARRRAAQPEALADAVEEVGALLERADRRPEGILDHVRLPVEEALLRVGVADAAAQHHPVARGLGPQHAAALGTGERRLLALPLDALGGLLGGCEPAARDPRGGVLLEELCDAPAERAGSEHVVG